METGYKTWFRIIWPNQFIRYKRFDCGVNAVMQTNKAKKGDLIGSLGDAGKTNQVGAVIWKRARRPEQWTVKEIETGRHAKTCSWLVNRLPLTENSGWPCGWTDLYFAPLFFQEGIQTCQHVRQRYPFNSSAPPSLLQSPTLAPPSTPQWEK